VQSRRKAAFSIGFIRTDFNSWKIEGGVYQMRKYSKAQEAYMLAVANVDVLTEQSKTWSENWLQAHNLSELKSPYTIEDDALFEKWAIESSLYEESIGLTEAEDLKNQAEQNLINWGLSKVKKDLPKGIYKTLLRGIKQYKIRQELIELTLKVQM
jgi:hypothetical protein